jgi:hypothetical protein
VIRNAKKEFWLICCFYFSMDATGFPFLAMASQFFYDKYGIPSPKYRKKEINKFSQDFLADILQV